jgi:phosphoribosyl 1,2-cyclic phosphate phosphodiesterase
MQAETVAGSLAASADRMRVIVMGSGTSSGVPVIGCQCPVCTSAEPKNQRTRASVAVGLAGATILIDTATDLRQQALRWGLDRVDAVLYTHAHADHVHGVDELRLYNLRQLQQIPCYAGPDVAERIRAYFAYIFSATESEGFRPYLELIPIDGPFELLGLRVIPVPLLHGSLPVFGFRLGGFAYLTDVSEIPPGSWSLLEGLDLLILDALRPKPHPTHFCLEQALAVVERLKPRRTALTHVSHLLEHRSTNEKLPIGVELAFDGMVFELPLPEREAKSSERSLR